jgi:hypothetical protein
MPLDSVAAMTAATMAAASSSVGSGEMEMLLLMMGSFHCVVVS